MKKIKDLVLSINEENSDEICQEISYKLMCEYQLNIDNNLFNITELEFYVYSSDHKDPYVHKKELQKEFGKFYVHQKDGNYGGIDITFGDIEKEIYCGVLIRGLKSENGRFLSGPNIIKKEIYKILKVSKYNELQEIVNKKIKFINKNIHKSVYYSTRIGLKPKFEDYLKNGKYIYKLHRFITDVENTKHKFKEINNVKKYNRINGTTILNY